MMYRPSHCDIGLPRRRPITGGFSLLEALVTLVVISVGILGVLGLQTASLVNTRVASLRSHAIVASDNFAARMRANPAAGYDGVASVPDIKNNASCDKGFAAPLKPEQVRKVAVCEWSETLQDKLPHGRGYIECVDGAPCQHYYITITWYEKRQTGNGQTTNGNANQQTSSKNREHCDANANANRCLVTEVQL